MTEIQRRLTAALAGRYGVERELGQGGMATVYLAHDLRHERQVAIKVLHPDLGAALGAERFLAEIKVTARLQHPHILPLLDSGAADGLLFYVMPYIAGETLRARLARETVLPIAEAVRLAGEVAGALDYAHRQGVVHRDIKPENILLHDGSALVADFGIALAVQQAGGARMTQTGLSLGTPQYMSPEQAMGERAIDARSDQYALGAVTYEMLTGDPPFTGSTVQAIVAKVLTERPVPPTTVRDTIPPQVERAVLAALAKLPADRLESARQFADILSGRAAVEASPAARAVPRPAATPRARWSVGLMATVSVAALAFAAWRGATPTAAGDGERYRLQLDLSRDGSARLHASSAFTVAPNGRLVAYVLADTSGRRSLWVRRLDSLQGTRIETDDDVQLPFWSPDSREVGFVAGGDVRRVDLRGGRPVTVARLGELKAAPIWMPGGAMVFASATGDRLLRLQPGARAPEELVRPDTARGFPGVYPVAAYPDGRHVLVYTFHPDDSRREFHALDVSADRPALDHPLPRLLGTTETMSILDQGIRIAGARYLINRGGDLWSQPYDDTFDAAGDPTVFVSGTFVRSFSVSDSGVLAYFVAPDTRARRLVLVDPTGRVLRSLGPVADGAGYDYYAPRFSPDGKAVAYEFHSGKGTGDLYVYDLATDQPLRQTLDETHHNAFAAWSPDGREVVFQSTRRGDDLFIKTVNGAPERRIPLAVARAIASDWSPDGRVILFNNRLAGGDVWRTSPTGDSVAPVLNSPANEVHATFSPNGRYIAYASDEQGGRFQVYVRRWPLTDEKWLVSSGYGEAPRWRRDGRALHYLQYEQGDARVSVMAVDVDARGGAFTAGVPRQLFRAPMKLSIGALRSGVPYDASPDGRAFAIVRFEEVTTPVAPTLHVYVHWAAALAGGAR
jgi:serine/threonine-protein kinase